MENEFADRLRLALSMKNMSQQDLVNKTKIGKSTISQYLSGKYKAKQDNISKIADALDVSETWLMGISDEMTRNKLMSTKSPFGPDNEIEEYLCSKGREDLWQTFKSVSYNDSLQILMDSAADLTPEDLEPVLILVQGIRKSKGLE